MTYRDFIVNIYIRKECDVKKKFLFTFYTKVEEIQNPFILNRSVFVEETLRNFILRKSLWWLTVIKRISDGFEIFRVAEYDKNGVHAIVVSVCKRILHTYTR